MPTEISGLRIARSFITPTDSEVQRTIDFQLGVRQGISIEGVLGEIVIDNGGFTASATTLTAQGGLHTLHLQSGSLETVPDQAGEDEDTIDSEVFYRQQLTVVAIDEPTAQGAAGISVTPNGVWVPPRPLFSARNITHRGITFSATLDLLCHVTIYFVFVEFSLAELGLILARRS